MYKGVHYIRGPEASKKKTVHQHENSTITITIATTVTVTVTTTTKRSLGIGVIEFQFLVWHPIGFQIVQRATVGTAIVPKVGVLLCVLRSKIFYWDGNSTKGYRWDGNRTMVFRWDGNRTFISNFVGIQISFSMDWTWNFCCPLRVPLIFNCTILHWTGNVMAGFVYIKKTLVARGLPPPMSFYDL